MPYKDPEKARLSSAQRQRKYAAKNREKINAKQNALRKGNPVEARKKSAYRKSRPMQEWHARLRYKYGMTPGEFANLAIKQTGSCAVCETNFSSNHADICVDHDHGTGHVRGVLCRACNLLLGYAQDSVVILASAICYLSNRKGEQNQDLS